MEKIFEGSYSDESTIKDGGFIFQAILNYDLQWSIVNGNASFNQNNIQGWLKQVDIFPDMRFNEGHATLTYVLLSEVNLLKRKFELASETIKRIINPDYAKEMNGELSGVDDSNEIPKPVDGDIEKNNPQQNQENTVNEVVYTTKLTSDQINSINDKYFKGTQFDIRFKASDVVLREVSTSGLDTGSPNVTLKLSTGMVDTLDGKVINSWDNFKLVVSSKQGNLTIDNSTTPKISEIIIYDSVDNTNELIFRTILPSLVLDFRGDRVKIDTYSNMSSQIAIRSNIDFDNLFNIEEAPKNIEEPIEGEDQEIEKGSTNTY